MLPNSLSSKLSCGTQEQPRDGVEPQRHKEHIEENLADLYNRAREIAMINRKIRSGWSKAGLYPFNARKVLDDMQEAPANNDIAAVAANALMLISPTLLKTPTTSMSLVALQQKLGERPEHGSGIDPYLRKLMNVAQQAFAERELLKGEIEDLAKHNNEKKTRQHVKERKVGEAKIISYEDIVGVINARDHAEAEKAEKRKKKERRRLHTKSRNRGR